MHSYMHVYMYLHTTYVLISHVYVIPCVLAYNLLFRNFEKTFTGQIIDPNDLVIKEQIGEGEYMATVAMYCNLY